MANNCYNFASISGEKAVLDLIEANFKKAESVRGDGTLFWDTLPMLLGESEAMEAPDDIDGEYGSKWFEPHLERCDSTTLVISGNSAWAPVNELWLKISKVYGVQVTASYEEGGSDLGGWYECDCGKVTRDEETTFIMYQLKEYDFESILDGIDPDDMDFESYCIENCEFVKALSVEQYAQLVEHFNLNQ